MDELSMVTAVAAELHRAGIDARVGGSFEFPCLRIEHGGIQWNVGPVGGDNECGWDRIAEGAVSSGFLRPSPRSVAEAVVEMLAADKGSAQL
jgi:hypothetical protein